MFWLAFLILALVIRFSFREKKESIYYNGRHNTPKEQEQIDEIMDEFLEENPNITFFKQHPEYVENYLNRIDLSELNVDTEK